MWLSKYAEPPESSQKPPFSLSFAPNLLLVPLSWSWEMLTRFSPTGCNMCFTFQLFLSCFPCPPFHTAVQLFFMLFPEQEALLTSSCPFLKSWDLSEGFSLQVYTSKGFLWSLWSVWNQCCDSSTQAESASGLPTPKLCLFVFQDNGHVCSAWAAVQLCNCWVRCFPKCGFFILEAQEVSLALGSWMEAAHWRFDGGGGCNMCLHGEEMSLYLSSTCFLTRNINTQNRNEASSFSIHVLFPLRQGIAVMGFVFPSTGIFP